MFKVLPQMHRLADQVCAAYGVEIAGVVVNSNDFGSVGRPLSYYIVKLKANVREWRYLSCRPIRNGREASKSLNNVTVVALTGPSADDTRTVIPSWRGRLVKPESLEQHRYHIERGYMTVHAGIDFVESEIIERYERGTICTTMKLMFR